MIECQHQQLTSLVMGATAIGALAPFVLDRLTESLTGGAGRKIDEREHIVVPVFGRHPPSSIAPTLEMLSG